VRRLLLNPEVRPVWGRGDEAALLRAYARVWERKRILREIFAVRYRKIAAALHPGNVVEIGAGTGNFQRWLAPRPCWTLDILRGPNVNIQADATRLPVADGRLDNIVVLDALHHLAQPLAFLRAAAAALRPGGRLLLVEPYISPWGYIVNKYLHHETVDCRFEETTAPKQAWAGNAAIPKLLLAPAHRAKLPLRVRRIEYFENFALVLSGGFTYRALLPEAVLLGLHRLEQCRLLRNRWLTIRVFTVLEKP
jgi:SAM-dependent methyltransferase